MTKLAQIIDGVVTKAARNLVRNGGEAESVINEVIRNVQCIAPVRTDVIIGGFQHRWSEAVKANLK